MLIRKCDKCDKEIKNDMDFGQFEVYLSKIRINASFTVDLCQDCTKEFLISVKRKEEAKELCRV